MLRPEMMGHFESFLENMGKVDKLDIFLRSQGGVAELPWHIVSLVREFCDQFGVLIADRALSGATHIAIAADELVMTPTARLGSVDPRRQHPLLPKDANGIPISVSVEELKLCVNFIREQLGESYPSQNLALIISELFKYIDPLALGALEQSYNLSKLITKKCLRSRRQKLEENHIESIVEMLASKYYSHSFLISRSEVESDLELPVTRPDAELSALLSQLQKSYFAQFAQETPPDRQGVSLKLAWVMQNKASGVLGVMIRQLANPVAEIAIAFSKQGVVP
jgi:hypothetical protein